MRPISLGVSDELGQDRLRLPLVPNDQVVEALPRVLNFLTDRYLPAARALVSDLVRASRAS